MEEKGVQKISYDQCKEEIQDRFSRVMEELKDLAGHLLKVEDPYRAVTLVEYMHATLTPLRQIAGAMIKFETSCPDRYEFFKFRSGAIQINLKGEMPDEAIESKKPPAGFLPKEFGDEGGIAY